MFKHSNHHSEKFRIRHWMKHTAVIPKGFLRYFVLKLISLKPMSGAEIIEEIGKRTCGRWKPSPGSIYPLLAWLQDNEIIEEAPTEEAGVKRYKLTEKGQKIVEKSEVIRKELKAKFKFLIPPLTLALLWTTPSDYEEAIKLEEAERRFMSAIFELVENLEEKLSKEVLDEVKEILIEASQKIEEINKKLRREEQDDREYN